jgi:hypothetical protein
MPLQKLALTQQAMEQDGVAIKNRGHFLKEEAECIFAELSVMTIEVFGSISQFLIRESRILPS